MPYILETQGTLAGGNTLDLSTVVDSMDFKDAARPAVVVLILNVGTAAAQILRNGTAAADAAEQIVPGDPPYPFGGDQGMLAPFGPGTYTLNAPANADLNYSVYRVV